MNFSAVVEAGFRPDRWPRIFRLSEDVFLFVLHAVESYGSTHLAEEARVLINAANGTVDQILLDYWRNPSDTQFFAKAFLQPYTRWLVESGGQPLDRRLKTMRSAVHSAVVHRKSVFFKPETRLQKAAIEIWCVRLVR